MSPSSPHVRIAALGLGPMGAAIARTVAESDHLVTAWNRTSRPLADLNLEGLGVTVAPSPPEAVAEAEIVVICVRDHTASRDLVAQVPAANSDAVVVNLSTGTPVEAVRSATQAQELGLRYVTQAQELGLRYVTGAVMVPTPMVGTDQSFALYAGSPGDVEVLEPFLAAMGGTSDVVGEDHAVPPALDLAMLDVYFAGMYAFLHSAAMVGAHGIDPARYLPYAEGIVTTLGASLPDLAEAIERRTYDAGEARLDMCLAFLEHIVATSEELGIEPGLAAVVRDASASAMGRRPASTDWDVVAEDLLVPSATTSPIRAR